jgi:hypothetical protein
MPADRLRSTPATSIRCLPPDRLAKIDIVLIGDRTGAGADGTADQRSFDRCPEQSAAYDADTGTDSTATKGAI